MDESAKNLIAKKRRVDIAVDQTQKLAGTKPGINLPIVFEDKIVGVIGISGDPNGISQFGELVKMGAEMSLKQAALTEQLQWDDRLREEDRKSTRLNSSHVAISYAVFCLKRKQSSA